MNLFAISGLLIGITSSAMGVLMFVKGKQKLHYSWGIFCLSAAVWGFGGFKVAMTQDPKSADFWWRILHIGVIFIPVFFTHFVYRFLKIERKWFIIIIYSLAILFLVTNFINGLFITNMRWVFNQFYYDSPPGPFYIPFTAFFFFLVIYSIFLLWKAYRKAQGIFRTQIKYLFWGMLISFSGSSLSFLPVYHLNLYPFLNFAGFLYPIIVGYSILRYRLLDIRLIIARSLLYFLLILYVAGLFTFLSFVVGELLVKKTGVNSAFIPLIISFIIVIGLDPIKRILTKYTDKIFYKGRIDYQRVLRRLSEVIAREIKLEELLESITNILTRELKLKNVVALVADKKSKFFKPESYLNGRKAGVLSADNPIIKYLKKEKNIIITEELGRLADDIKEPEEKKRLQQVKTELDELGTNLCLPVIIEQELISILLIGPKLSGDMFSGEDIRLFEVIAPQMAAALEKAKLYEEVQDFTKTLQQRVDKATHELKNANIHLRQLDKAKSEFLSIAAHQLRTPLTGIKGYLSMLIDGDFGPLTLEPKKIMKGVFESSERLNRLVNVFLNISRIESGRLKLEKQPAFLDQLVKGLIHNFKLEAQKKGLKLKFIKPSKKIPTLSIDQDKITDVINNLIDNAIKYTEKGKVTVKLELEKNNVLFQITDTGIGMSNEDTRDLFNKFSRSQASEKINTTGSGLGLYIAKRLLEAHNGKIWAHSPGPGKGSTFNFTLPIK